MKKTIILAGIFAVLLSSCKEENLAKYEITNNAGSVVDSVFVTPNFKPDAEKYISIEPGKTVNYVADMAPVGRGEGLYAVHFKLNGKNHNYDFGRYKNGQHLAHKITITIEKDTVFYKIYPKEFY